MKSNLKALAVATFASATLASAALVSPAAYAEHDYDNGYGFSCDQGKGEVAFFDKIVFKDKKDHNKLKECKVKDDPRAFDDPIEINDLLKDCLKDSRPDVDVVFVDFAAVCVDKKRKY